VASCAWGDSPKAVSYSVDSNTSQFEVEWSYLSEALIRLGPLVAEELVMIMDRSGVVTTIDRASGEIVWQYESGYAVGVVLPATPKWVFHDDKLIFSVNSEKLVALNYQTGEVIWETPFPNFRKYINFDNLLATRLESSG
jgi:outer membrane protein assembly factor BamB